MYKGFKIITFTHKHCNIRDISKYVVQEAGELSLDKKLAELKDHFQIQELLYLATCNRVMYFFYQDEKFDMPDVSALLYLINPNLHDNELEKAASRAEIFEGADVLEHLFEVASSLDSLVIGEREIFRQLKDAYTYCAENKLTGDNIRLVMKYTIQAGKDVYANTAIGEKPLSIVALAIQKMQEISPPKNARILMIGAGQTNLLFAKFLSKYGFENVTVFNRTLERAIKITEKFNGKSLAYTLDQLDAYKQGFDVMIVCTGAHEAIIHSSNFTHLLAGEKDEKLVIDLAMPSNVSNDVQTMNEVNYIDIEQLRNLASINLEFRRTEVTKARKILDKHLIKFRQTYHQRMIERAMKHVPEEIKAIRHKAVSEVFAKELASMDNHTRLTVENMLEYMEKKCISVPIKAAKQIALN